MATSNPLHVLGIAPSALADKSNKQQKRLVELVGKAQLVVEHPDAGGDAERFTAIQNAIAQLEDPEAFIRFRSDLLKPQGTKLAEMTAAYEARTAQFRASRAQLISYLQSMVDNKAATVVSTEPINLTIMDYIENQKSGGFSKVAVSYQLSVSGGKLMETRKGRTRVVPRKLIGTVRPDSHAKGIAGVLHMCQPRDNPAAKRIARRGTTVVLGAPNPRTHLVPWKLSAPILERLSPKIERYTYLFSFTRIDGEPYLYFEGSVHAVSAAGQQ
jgi:hypothetical protein